MGTGTFLFQKSTDLDHIKREMVFSVEEVTWPYKVTMGFLYENTTYILVARRPTP